MKNAVFPGSFDPFTVGHLDILKRACEIFDHVTVCVIPNPAKHYLFGDEDRVMLINRVIEAEGIKNAAEEETVAEEPKKHTHTAKMKSKPIDDDEEDEYEDEEDEEEKGGFFGKLFGKKMTNIDFDDDDFDDED